MSPVHFVTDPVSARRPVGANAVVSRSHHTRPTDLWGEDTAFLLTVMDDLTTLSAEMSARRAAATAIGRERQDEHTHAGSERLDGNVDPWLWLQAKTTEEIGPWLASFALATESAPHDAANWGQDWTDKPISDTTAGLAGDTPEDIVEASESAAAEEFSIAYQDHRSESERLRRLRQAWVAKGVALAPTLPEALKLFVGRVALRFWQGGAWDPGDVIPVTHVAALLKALDRSTGPSELQERVRSFTGIALAMMRRAADLRHGGQRTLLYRRALADADELGSLDMEVTQSLLSGLVPPESEELWLDEIQTLARNLLIADPLADVVETLSTNYPEVHRPGLRSLHVEGRFGNPELVALEAIGRAEDQDGIAAWASNDRGDWALVAWRRPEMVQVSQQQGRRVRWRHFGLPALLGPAAFARQARSGEQNSRYEIRDGLRFTPTRAMEQVLRELGIEDPAPPVQDVD